MFRFGDRPGFEFCCGDLDKFLNILRSAVCMKTQPYGYPNKS